jgi:hypothetical protein
MRVCMLCVALLPISALAAGPTAQQRLDLKAPNIHEVWTSQQIAAVLAHTQDPEQSESIEVQGYRGHSAPRTPVAWRGIAAPFWAVLHPADAWRIFAPLPPDQARPTPLSSQPYLTVNAQAPEMRAAL